MAIGTPFQPQRFRVPNDSRSINRMGSIVNVLRGIVFDKQFFSVSQTNSGMFVTTSARRDYGFPWGDMYTFGLERISTSVIRVHKGKLRRYGDAVYNAVSDTSPEIYTDVTFGGDGDNQQIFWSWNPTDGFEISHTPVIGAIADDDTNIRGVLSVWNVNNMIPELIDYVQCGMIHIPVETKADV